jgi:carotenoid cleavage dioxygenase-like enzyme
MCSFIGRCVFTCFVCVLGFLYNPPPYVFKPSQFLKDTVYAPVATEQDLLLSVNGSIPSFLIGGSFLRVGSNPIVVDHNAPYHWFEGDGMIFSASLRERSVVLKNRWIRTPLLEVRNRTQVMYSFLAELTFPSRVIPALLSMAWSSFLGRSLATTTGNTAFLFHQRRLFCLMEASRPIEVDPTTLATGPMVKFDGVTTSFTAHPKFDVEANELLSFGWLPPSNAISFYKHDGDGKLLLTKKIRFDGPLPRMPHDFACSERFCLFFDSSAARLDPLKLMGFGKPDLLPARIVYFSRETKEGQHSVEVKSGAIVHFANAFESGDELVVIAFRTNHSETYFDLDTVFPPTLYEIRINLLSNTLSSERDLLDHNKQLIFAEFPTINPRYQTRPSRYVYAMKLDKSSFFSGSGILKHDLLTGNTLSFEFCERLCRCQEPLFVANATDDAHSAPEDAGAAMTFVLDLRTNESSLVILDAQTLRLVATVPLRSRVPMGFHTVFLSQKELAGAVGVSIQN